MSPHDVALEAYKGPLDLLLHLIHENEVDIYDIPIADITEQYIRHIERIGAIDIDGAGEFIVMASTLMEIKSRMLLPPGESAEGEEEETDPRSDLVRQLLEYRRIKEAAGSLERLERAAMLRWGRLAAEETGGTGDAEKGFELGEIGMYDLFNAFDRLMKETLRDLPATLVYDDLTIEERIEKLILKLRNVPHASLRELFEDARDRYSVVGMFVALLELVRRNLVSTLQVDQYGEIRMALSGSVSEEDLKAAAQRAALLMAERAPAPAPPPEAGLPMEAAVMDETEQMASPLIGEDEMPEIPHIKEELLKPMKFEDLFPGEEPAPGADGDARDPKRSEDGKDEKAAPGDLPEA